MRSSQGKSNINLERIAFIFIFIFPVLGVFYPIETYFAPQDYSIAGAAAERNWPIPINKLAITFVSLWLAYHLSKYFKITASNAFLVKLPIIFCIYIVVSSLWSIDTSYSFNRGLRAIISACMVIYFFSMYSHDDMVKITVNGFMFAAIASILAVVIIPSYGMSMLNGYTDAWRGAFTHKNSLGSQMSMGVIISTYAILTRKIHPRTAWITLILTSICLIFSRSATSILSTAMCVLIMIFLINMINSRSASDRAIYFISFIFIGALAATLTFFSDELFILIGRDPTLTGRTAVWTATEALIAQAPPWGYGNAFWSIDSPLRASAWNTMGWAAPHAHSTTLDISLQLGVIGLGIYILLWIVCCTRAIRLMLTTTDLQLALWVSLLFSLFIRGFVETLFIEPGTGAIFSLTLCYLGISRMNFAIKLAHLKAKRPSRNRSAAPRKDAMDSSIRS